VEGGVIREEMIGRLTGRVAALFLAALLVGCGGSHDFEFIQMNAVAVSPDGAYIAAACLDGRVYVWNAQTRVRRWRSG
jgi:hypothetical protein